MALVGEYVNRRFVRKRTDLHRLITVCQVLYFSVSTLARVVQGLAITTLELTVLGFILCTLATSICWWHKPNSVMTGHTFNLTKSMEDIIREAGEDADGSYRDTPLDFVSCERWSGNVLWPYYVNILWKTGLFRDRHKSRPVQRLSSFSFPKPSTRRSEHLVLWLGLVYAALFFAAWNFYFPTETERVLWRLFAATQFVLSACIGILEVTQLTWPTRRTRPCNVDELPSTMGPEKLDKIQSRKVLHWFHRVWHKPINNSISQNPFYEVPLGSLLLTTPLCAAYCICRWYLFLEDIIALRSLPSSAYQTVDWTQYWPSF